MLNFLGVCNTPLQQQGENTVSPLQTTEDGRGDYIESPFALIQLCRLNPSLAQKTTLPSPKTKNTVFASGVFSGKNGARQSRLHPTQNQPLLSFPRRRESSLQKPLDYRVKPDNDSNGCSKDGWSMDKLQGKNTTSFHVRRSPLRETPPVELATPHCRSSRKDSNSYF